MSKRKACKRCGAFTTSKFCRNEDCMVEHIEEPEAERIKIEANADYHADKNDELMGQVNKLQRKYDALIQKLHDKMNELDNRRGAGSQLLELDELRALLENDDEH